MPKTASRFSRTKSKPMGALRDLTLGGEARHSRMLQEQFAGPTIVTVEVRVDHGETCKICLQPSSTITGKDITEKWLGSGYRPRVTAEPAG